MSTLVDPLAVEIAATEERLAVLRAKHAAKHADQQGSWPKPCTLYVSGDRLANNDVGKQLGLVGQALHQFGYLTDELALHYAVGEDGTAVLVGVDKQALTGLAGGYKADDPCLARVAPGEPIFVLRAQDRLAPTVIQMWCILAAAHGCPPEKLAEARACAGAMEHWPTQKYPD